MWTWCFFAKLAQRIFSSAICHAAKHHSDCSIAAISRHCQHQTIVQRNLLHSPQSDGGNIRKHRVFFSGWEPGKQTWFNHNQVANMALHVLSLSPLFSWLTTVNLPWRSRGQWIWSEKLWVLKDTPSHYPNHLRWFISHITCKVCNHFNVQGSLSSHSSIEMIPPKVVFVSRKNLQNPRHSNGQDIAVV